MTSARSNGSYLEEPIPQAYFHPSTAYHSTLRRTPSYAGDFSQRSETRSETESEKTFTHTA